MAYSSKTRPKARVIGFLVTLGVVLLVGLGVWKFSIFGQGPSRLAQELSTAKADGLPLDATDLRASLSTPDDKNAAPLLLTAFSELKSFDQTPEGKKLSTLTGRNGGVAALAPSKLNEIAPSISHLSHLFGILSQAVQKPKLDFHRPWEVGPGIMFPEFSEEKSCCTKLVLRAKFDLAGGKTLEALDSLDVAAKLSNLVGQDPVVIGLLVQTSLRSMVYDALTEILDKQPEGTSVLERTKTVLNDLGPRPDVRPAIRSEFLMGRIAVKMLGGPGGASLFGSDGGSAVFKIARFGPARTLYDLRFTQIYDQLYRALSQHPSSILAIQKAFQDSQIDLDTKMAKDWTYGLVEMIAPVFVGMSGAVGESEARRNVLLSAIDVLDAKLHSGHFSAEALGSSGHWLDPFTERPLIYRATNSGFLIYSVGKDGKDDGGNARPKNFSGENYDIPFSFP